MELTIKLKARGGWGNVEAIDFCRLERCVVGLTTNEVGLTLAECIDLLSERQRLVLQTQMLVPPDPQSVTDSSQP
jgi:hypothetical protein